MKKCLMLLVLCGMLAGMMMTAGCTSAESFDEHARRLWLTTDLQARNMVEDWDYIWLNDHSSRLSDWHMDIGS